MTQEVTTDKTSADTVEQSARQLFTERLRTYATGHPELSAGEVSERVCAMLLDEDRALAEAFFVREGQLILSFTLRTDMIQTRRGVYQSVYLTKDGVPEIETMSERKRQSVYEQISRWREYDPISKKAQPFLSFTKTMLIESAKHDAAAAVHHGVKSSFKLDIAEQLPDDESIVSDHFSADQILEVMKLARADSNKEILNGTIKIKIKPGQLNHKPILPLEQSLSEV